MAVGDAFHQPDGPPKDPGVGLGFGPAELGEALGQLQPGASSLAKLALPDLGLVGPLAKKGHQTLEPVLAGKPLQRHAQPTFLGLGHPFGEPARAQRRSELGKQKVAKPEVGGLGVHPSPQPAGAPRPPVPALLEGQQTAAVKVLKVPLHRYPGKAKLPGDLVGRRRRASKPL